MGRRGRRKGRRRGRRAPQQQVVTPSIPTPVVNPVQPTKVAVPPQVSIKAPAIKPSGLKFGLGGNLMKLKLPAPQKNPVFYEDWDLNDDGQLNVVDIQGWAGKGRQDLAKQLATRIGSGNLPAKRPVPVNPTKKQAVRKVYGIPKTRWAKLKPNQRRAIAQRFRASARARVQATRRQNRMFRGAARLTGQQPSSADQGRLRRTSRRMHLTLDRARRKRRIKG